MLRLVGPDGRAVSLGPLRFAADSRRSIVTALGGPMFAGIYTVTWQMAGDDGHPVRGKYDFVVAPGAAGIGVLPAAVDDRTSAGAKQSAASPMRDSMHHDPASMPQGNGFGSESPVYVVIRWLQFIGLLLAIGAVSFRFFVLGTLRRAAKDASSGVTHMISVAERSAADLGRIATGFLAITLLLRLGAQSYAMHGAADAFDMGLVAQMVQGTKWGWGWLVQLIGIVLAGAGYQRARRTSVLEASDPKETNARAFWWRVAAMGAALAAVAPALSGHGYDSEDPQLHEQGDAVLGAPQTRYGADVYPGREDTSEARQSSADQCNRRERVDERSYELTAHPFTTLTGRRESGCEQYGKCAEPTAGTEHMYPVGSDDERAKTRC